MGKKERRPPQALASDPPKPWPKPSAQADVLLPIVLAVAAAIYLQQTVDLTALTVMGPRLLGLRPPPPSGPPEAPPLLEPKRPQPPPSATPLGEDDAATLLGSCTFGPGAEYETVEQLFRRGEPCLVLGLEADLHTTLREQFAPSFLAALPAATSSMLLRTAEADPGTTTKVMRHSTRSSKDGKWAKSARLGLTWPRHEYDDWEFSHSTLHSSILQPGLGRFASFSADPSTFQQPHPDGVAAVDALAARFCPHGSCPVDGPRRVVRSHVSLSSRGLAEQLHLVQEAELVFHLHGDGRHGRCATKSQRPIAPFKMRFQHCRRATGVLRMTRIAHG